MALVSVEKKGQEWLDMDPKNSSMDDGKSKRTRANPPVDNKIFERLAEVTEDPFWVDRLMDAKRGAFPSKISYANGVLQYKTVNDTYAIMFSLDKLDDEEYMEEYVAECVSLFISFYQKSIQMYSPGDVAKRERDDLNRVHDDEITLWTKLNKRSAQLIIYDFAQNERKNRNLSQSEYETLKCVLNLANILKYINNDSVVLYDQCIVEQNFLIFDEIMRRYTLNDDVYIPMKSKPVARKKKSKNEKTYGQRWMERLGRIESQKPSCRFYKYPSGENLDGDDSITETSDMQSR
jgi:hypothetical protein